MPESAEIQSVPTRAPLPRRARLTDLLLVLLLLSVAIPMRLHASHGDLWLDEADYSFAAIRGIAANRHDVSGVPGDPLKLIRFRHYHPPLIADTLRLMLFVSPQDRVLRLPAVLAGAATIALIYLCGLALFAGSRPIAFACGLILAVTPPDIRVFSHALPWFLILFWLILLLWALLRYIDTRAVGWLVLASGSLGGMFVTSEMFYPMLLATGLALPFLFGGSKPDAGGSRRIALALLAGFGLFLLIAWIVWPAGLTGHSVLMLRHYMAMSHDRWIVAIRGRTYTHAPKWAYLYWYSRWFPAFFLCYLLGGITLAAHAVRRKLPPKEGVLLVMTAMLLFTAHRAHIIGPEYLADCLPFLTLAAGLGFQEILSRNRKLGIAVVAAACFATILIPTQPKLLNLDADSLRPRWPLAARFLATRWRPGNSMLAPSYGAPARWYIAHQPGIQIKEWEVQALPAANVRPRLLQEIAEGDFHFIAVRTTEYGHPIVDPAIQRILDRLPIIWRSPEAPGEASHLIIYEAPHPARSPHRAAVPSTR